MSNRNFGFPLIMSEPTFPGITDEPIPTEIGGGSDVSGQNGKNSNKIPFACSFETWSEKFASDCYKDGIVDFNDYGQWWADSGLGEDAWNQFNTGLPFNWKSQNER
jgi:hypothetical protein